MGKLGWLDDAVKGAARNLDEAAQAAANQLDMSTAARMQRAAEQSTDTARRLYHGTGRDFPAFDVSKGERHYMGKGVHLAESPGLASNYANQWGGGNNVVPVFTKANLNLADENTYSRYYHAIRAEMEDGVYGGDRDWQGELAKRMQADGYDGVRYNHPNELTVPGESKTVDVIFDPANIRSVNAAFDPANIGKNDLLGAATIGGMATAGAVGAGLMGAQAYDFGTPDYDAKIQEFRNRRAAKSQIWKELKQAGATIASAIPAGIVSDAYRIGGYLSPVTSLDETEQGAEAIQNALMYTPDGENRYLNEFARQIEQFEKDVQPMVKAWKQTPIYKGYKQLPERAQQLVKTASDYAF